MSSTSGSGVIVGARIVMPSEVIEEGTLVFDGGRIQTLAPGEHGLNQDVFRADGLTLLPGFLDVHIHGGGGSDTMDATPDGLQAICRLHARYGTTGLLATTMTQSREKISAALRNARLAHESGSAFCADGAQVLGIHLEGPYIHPARPGAQPKEFVRDYDVSEFADWLQISGGAMKLITLAPERPGGEALVDACLKANIVVSMGHTDATSEETQAALGVGVRHATHLFNAMPAIHHRKPGPIPILLTDSRACVEIIADGHHVAPEVIKMVLAAKGANGIILITDAIAGAGIAEGVYDLGGQAVTVANGKATLADGTLAGSVLTMSQAAKNIVGWFALKGAEKWQTIAALTSGNVARQFGWNTKGAIQAGQDADMVLVDDALNVHATFVAGRCGYRTG